MAAASKTEDLEAEERLDAETFDLVWCEGFVDEYFVDELLLVSDFSSFSLILDLELMAVSFVFLFTPTDGLAFYCSVPATCYIRPVC